MTTTKKWAFIVNPFLTATDSSYANTQRISNFHLSALFTASQTDNFYLGLYNTYKPLHDTFETNYTTWLSQGGTQQGSGITLQQLLDETTTKINSYDATIQGVYPKATNSYKALLPHGHSAFTEGSQLNRINTVNALSTSIVTAITNDATLTVDNKQILSNLNLLVIAFYNDLKAAFDAKNNQKNTTKVHSDTCENSRIALCIQQYINLGTLIAKYAATPDSIATYFDLINIRSYSQTDFTHQVKSQHVYTITKHTMAATDQIRINNTGNVPLRFYAANSKDVAIGTVFIEVAAGANADYVAALLGDVANNHFIIVYNPDAVQTGSFVLGLL
jgi:hypothetical protein